MRDYTCMCQRKRIYIYFFFFKVGQKYVVKTRQYQTQNVSSSDGLLLQLGYCTDTFTDSVDEMPSLLGIYDINDTWNQHRMKS